MPKQSGVLTASALLSLLLCACETAPAETHAQSETIEPLDLSSPATLALACSGCHGPEGGAIASLEDRTSDQIRLALLGYKSDEYGGSVMHRMMRGYSETDINAISLYLAETAQE